MKNINWSNVKTNIIVAFIATTVGLIGGYYTSIDLHSDARADVVNDIQKAQVLKDQSR